MINERQKPDIHRVDKNYETTLEYFKRAGISNENKQLCLEFVNDLKIGWGGGTKKVGKLRLIKYLQILRQLSEMLESLEQPDHSLAWSYIQKKHVKELLLMFDNHKGWDEWSVHSARTVLKRFVTWIRKEKGYPEGYPERDRLSAIMPLVKYPVEVDYSTPRPRKLKPINEIPTEQEVNWLIQAWDYYRGRTGRAEVAARNKAFIAVIAEVGIRVGGLGNRQIKDVLFDDLGAKIGITDKTMQGEPVRLMTSVPYLREWLDLHPWRNDPEAPLWPVVFNEVVDNNGKLMSYANLQRILIQTRRLHNERAKEEGLPLITRRLHFHAFRYYAQTRDMLEGMPVSVQCAQRGWKPDSDRPQMYARITTGAVDEWLIKHYRLARKTADTVGSPPK